MKTGLAAWHYPHRKQAENVTFFFDHGFDFVSLLGHSVASELRAEETRAALSRAVQGRKITVHYALPRTHGEEDVARYREEIDLMAAWQAETGAIDILSFDVPGAIRGNVAAYVRYAMERVGVRTAVEDYGLNEAELCDLRTLAGEERFGFLIDLGHMFLRFRGENTSGATLFTQSALETNDLSADGIARNLREKPFPIFEMHLHNNDGVRDTHRFLPDGEFDIPTVARAVKMIGFDGAMTIESAPGYQFPCYGEDADAGILRDLALWRGLIAEA